MKKIFTFVIMIMMIAALIRAVVGTGTPQINDIIIDLSYLKLDTTPLKNYIQQLNPANQFNNTIHSWQPPNNPVEFLKSILTSIATLLTDITNGISNIWKLTFETVNFIFTLIKTVLTLIGDLFGI